MICKSLETTIPESFTKLYSRRRKKGKTMKILESPEVEKLARLFHKMPVNNRKRFIGIGKSLMEESWDLSVSLPDSSVRKARNPTLNFLSSYSSAGLSFRITRIKSPASTF